MSTAAATTITHVIFDLDGTLIDSERCLIQATNSVLKSLNKNLNYDWNIRSKTLGLHLAKASRIIVDYFHLDIKPEEYYQKVMEQFCSLVRSNVDMMPGARRLVDHLAKHHVPMAICTGSTEESFRNKIVRFNDFFEPKHIFHHIVIAGSDPEVGENNKPHPRPYQVCIRRFENGAKIKPEQVLVFEDSPTGACSALSAGCPTVLIPSCTFDMAVFGPLKPTLIISSMLEFRPEQFGLPSFDDDKHT